MDLSSLFLLLASTVLLLWVTWFILFADTDVFLALNEAFGHPVSVFEGKVVWVTGASSGLGEAMAYVLSTVRAKLVLSARNAKRLEQVRNKCLEIARGKLDHQDILVLPFDVTAYDIHEIKVAEALSHFGQIDVLINNAGRFQIGPCEQTEIEVDQDLFAVNFFGPIMLTKLVLKHFLARGQGQIVCISSAIGKTEIPCMATYCATKHALHGYYNSLRAEHHKNNIDVTIVCPGFFESEMQNQVMSWKKGEIYSSTTNCSVVMSAARCSHLTLTAVANKSYEGWVAHPFVLIFLWLSEYAPYLSKRLILMGSTKQAIAQIIKGNYPKQFPVWKPLLR